MSLKFLLADSNDSFYKVLELALNSYDAELVFVTSGHAAMERAVSWSPDVVLADTGLSDLDGYELSSRIKNEPSLANTSVYLLRKTFAIMQNEVEDPGDSDGFVDLPLSSGVLRGIVEMVESRKVDAGMTEPVEEEGIEIEPPEPGDEARSARSTHSIKLTDSESFADLTLEEDDTFVIEEPELPPQAVEAPDDMPPVDAPVAKKEESLDEALGIEEPEEPEEPFNAQAIEEEEPVTYDDPFDTAVTLDSSTVVDSSDEQIFNRQGAVKAPMPVSDEGTFAGVTADDLASDEGKRIIEAIVSSLSDEVIREIAWEVVPELAERMIKEAIDKITKTE